MFSYVSSTKHRTLHHCEFVLVQRRSLCGIASSYTERTIVYIEYKQPHIWCWKEPTTDRHPVKHNSGIAKSSSISTTTPPPTRLLSGKQNIVYKYVSCACERANESKKTNSQPANQPTIESFERIITLRIVFSLHNDFSFVFRKLSDAKNGKYLIYAIMMNKISDQWKLFVCFVSVL